MKTWKEIPEGDRTFVYQKLMDFERECKGHDRVLAHAFRAAINELMEGLKR